MSSASLRTSAGASGTTTAGRGRTTVCGGIYDDATFVRRHSSATDGSSVWILFAASFVALAAQAPAAEPVTGVTDTEILIGTITDLSGVTAVQGVNNANAMRLAFDEVNEKGGIHGRKIRYIVEDSQYQVPRAVQAMNKLLNNDGVFFTIEDGGTPMNNATFPMAIEKNMPKLLPLVRRALDVRAVPQAEVQPVLVLRGSDAGRGEVLRRAARQEGGLR